MLSYMVQYEFGKGADQCGWESKGKAASRKYNPEL